MTKLLTRYPDEPTEKNALKIRQYLAKHPMCECMLTREETEIMRGAIASLES